MNSAIRWIAVSLPMAGSVAAVTALFVLLFHASPSQPPQAGIATVPKPIPDLAPPNPGQADTEGIVFLDPFGLQTKGPDPSSSPEPDGTGHDAVLNLVAVTGSDRFCAIEGKIAREGQELAGVKIRSVSRDGVVVDKGERTIFIKTGERIP